MARKSVVDKRQNFAERCAAALGIGSLNSSGWSKYTGRPIDFIETELKESLTYEQKQILDSVCKNRETNVQACHGIGKSWIASRLTIYWIYCVGGLVITTGPTERQVGQIVWAEIRRIHGKLNLPGDIGIKFLRVNEEARGFGFTSNPKNSNAFQGIHHSRLLVIEDEACGISPEIDDGATSCVTGGFNRLLRIGNPIAGGNPFQKACSHRHIRVAAWGHPNVAWAYEKHKDGIHRLKSEVAIAILNPKNGEVLPQEEWPDWCQRDVIPGAISIAWIEGVRTKKGETSAFWQSRVEGMFPVDSAQSIVPRSWFLQARDRYDKDPEHWDRVADYHLWRHGLDVGDGGDDHATASWHGPVLYAARTFSTQGDHLDILRAAAEGKKLLKIYGGSINVDRAGVGSGALSRLLEEECNAYGTHWGESASDSAQYLNLKAEQYWMLREAFRLGEVAIAPLGEEMEEMLMEDLAGIYWEETVNGKIRIEDKKKTVARLHRSPNLGDAGVLGFAAKAATVEFQSTGIKRVASRLAGY